MLSWRASPSTKSQFAYFASCPCLSAARLRQEEARSMKVERPLEDVVFW